jgi:hypothetical protein
LLSKWDAVRPTATGSRTLIGVNFASDRTTGLAAFAAAELPCDLLLTDVMVPGPMNGKALAD